ncbi:35529_t:CDS:2 [Gigaspora margarita]|uniref:35529_t:CDS:1 n=1 Tax=Gigaspora margarita TaxID=4874 RepID=A0ABN7WMB4_GIGMA|nr:35529_t:CDS:2 [Gigaspora margarita]
MSTLQGFLKVEPIDQILISRILHKYWKNSEVNTKEADCKHVIKILKNLTNENIDKNQAPFHDIARFREKLNALIKDTDLFHPKHDKPNWKIQAMYNIGSMKDILWHQQSESQAHLYFYKWLCNVDINTLLCNDPLVNNIVDFKSSYFSLTKEEQNILVGKRSSIRELSKNTLIRQKVTHAYWVEQDYEREQVAKNITDDLLLKIKSNIFCRISNGSENSFVEAIAHLIKASLYWLPLEYNV